jgi:hypothetical protein
MKLIVKLVFIALFGFLLFEYLFAQTRGFNFNELREHQKIETVIDGISRWIPKLDVAGKNTLIPGRTYWLSERISFTTTSGVMGFPAGSPVQLIADSNDSLTVSIGNESFNIGRKQITTSKEDAENLAAIDRANVEDIRKINEQNNAEFKKRKLQEYIDAAESINRAQSRSNISGSGIELRLQVLQVLSDGVLGEQLEEVAVASGIGSAGGGAGEVATSFAKSGKIVFLQGVTGVTDGEAIVVRAQRDGIYEYPGTDNANGTVEKYIFIRRDL